jgi:hypothetical protein
MDKMIKIINDKSLPGLLVGIKQVFQYIKIWLLCLLIFNKLHHLWEKFRKTIFLFNEEKNLGACAVKASIRAAIPAGPVRLQAVKVCESEWFENPGYGQRKCWRVNHQSAGIPLPVD